MSDDHHDHEKGSRFSDVELRVRALESLLVDKRLVERETLDRLIDTFETKLGPREVMILQPSTSTINAYPYFSIGWSFN